MTGPGSAKWLAIDFGTCYSCAVRSLGGRFDILSDPIEHRYVIPSSVLRTPDGGFLIGHEAEDQRLRWPDRYQGEFKREFGGANPLPMGDREFTPEALVTEILRYFKREAEDGGETIDAVVLTVPVSYGEHRRKLMLGAGRDAGFKQVSLIDEPVAAVLAPGPDNRTGDGLMLVYDLGGGTFDIALVQLDGSTHSVHGADGDPTIGGLNFDRAIERDLKERGTADPPLSWVSENAIPGSADRLHAAELQRRARSFCRRAKHHLSRSERFDEELQVDGNRLHYELTRIELSQLVHADLSRTLHQCRQLLEDAGVTVDDLDRVVLVGGSCRLPFVAERIAAELTPRVQRLPEPELAVCLGAAAAYSGVPSSDISKQGESAPADKPALRAPGGANLPSWAHVKRVTD